MSNSDKSFLVLSAFMLMGFLVFYPALKIGFLGDFAGDLYGSQNNPEPLGTPASPGQLAELLDAPQTTALRYLPGNPENFIIIRKP